MIKNCLHDRALVGFCHNLNWNSKLYSPHFKQRLMVLSHQTRQTRLVYIQTLRGGESSACHSGFPATSAAQFEVLMRHVRPTNRLATEKTAIMILT